MTPAAATAPQPGDLGCYDAAVMDRWAPPMRRIQRLWHRPELRGVEHLPDGPFLGVGNHGGGTMIIDTVVWLSAYHRLGRPQPLLTLVHDAVFQIYPKPLARWLAQVGAVRADPEVAAAALRSGHCVQVYPGGDHDACRSWRNRHRIVFAGRTGYVKLAQRTQVPIVPVVGIGAQEGWVVLHDGVDWAERSGLRRKYRLGALPLSLSVPWGLWLGPVPGFVPLPSKIILQILPPIDPSGTVEAIDQRVREVMQTCLSELAQQRRWPLVG